MYVLYQQVEVLFRMKRFAVVVTRQRGNYVLQHHPHARAALSVLFTSRHWSKLPFARSSVRRWRYRTNMMCACYSRRGRYNITKAVDAGYANVLLRLTNKGKMSNKALYYTGILVVAVGGITRLLTGGKYCVIKKYEV